MSDPSPTTPHDGPTWNGKPLPREVKWIGSTYRFISVEAGVVTWNNPVSRHTATCSVDAWLRQDPYDKASR